MKGADGDRFDLGRDVRLRDRRDAGLRLARRLARYRRQPGATVLGMPRGGVVVAAEIARDLELPLDVILSRKVGAPGNPELAIGAVAEDGEPYLSGETVELTGASPAHVARTVEQERAEIARRQRLFRGGRPLRFDPGAIVILVDDGVATGSTMFAAIHALHRPPLGRLVVAVPVAPPETADVLRSSADELVVLATPHLFGAVGAFYDEFPQTGDDEVLELLAEARERTAREQGGRSPATSRPP